MRYPPSNRRGVSSIVGSIFFVLIMIVAIASLVSIFNSYSAYSNTVNKVADNKAQAINTGLALSGATFGSFPPSSPSKFNVTASCSTTSTSPTNQGKLFFSATMWWDFFTCNSNFQYSTSFDGTTWESATSIPSLVGGYTVGPYFDIQVVGATMFLVIAKCTCNTFARFQFAEGTLAAGGTSTAPAGTITWVAAPAEVTTSANVLGPIKIAEDGAGNEWVAVVQAATTIAVYEHEACATSANNGWEPNACDSSTQPTNYAPAALTGLTANANVILLSPPSTLASTGVILAYETGSATVPSTGTMGVVTMTSLAVSSTGGVNGWQVMTLTGLHDYSISSSSALFLSNTMYFAGLEATTVGQASGNLTFWTIPFTFSSPNIVSLNTPAQSTEQFIESTSHAWQAALTSMGTTLALFDAYPTSTVVQYYTSSTLGSIWNSPAITLKASETAVNGLSPASGGFAVTWANAAPNIRFAALSSVTMTNTSPFGVHLVDLYVQNPATNTLVAHYYANSSEDYDYWVGQGSSMVIPIRFIWSQTTNYLFTVGTDNGLTAQVTATSPPVAIASCPTGTFVSQILPTLVCTSLPAAASPAVAFSTNANTCTDSTSGTALMMGLGATYTTSSTSSGSVYVVLTFDVKSAAVSNINSKWQLAYGSGTAPTCDSASSGTPFGRQYTVNTEAAVVLETSQSVGVTITGLSTSTSYWFDVQATDSSADAWVYSAPSLSVMDILISGLQTHQVGYSSNTNTCTISSVSTLMAGLGTTYTTGGTGFSGNVLLTLTADAKSPATSAVNSQWRIAYGTGTAPACAAASTGTTVGNQYQIATEAAVVLEMGQSESVVITGLAASTAYWFDLQVTDSTTGSWIYSNPTLAVTQIPTAQNLPPNVNFASSANSCGRNTAANGMAGLGTTYTTLSSSAGKFFAALTFKVATPATSALNTKWQVVYGTGTVPACNAAATGTTVGQVYTINTEAAVAGGMGQTIGFVLSGLSRGTQYWFDVQATDSSTAVWTYSNPALSVMDIMPADFVHSNTEFSSNTNSCGRNTAATAMAGFATTYTTTSYGSGNIAVVMSFNAVNPAVNDASTYQVAYGTGTAPACNGASTGTTVGNIYTLTTNTKQVGGSGLAVGFTLVGLSTGATYWFDLRVADGTTSVWTYSNPQISVVELP